EVGPLVAHLHLTCATGARERCNWRRLYPSTPVETYDWRQLPLTLPLMQSRPAADPVAIRLRTSGGNEPYQRLGIGLISDSVAHPHPELRKRDASVPHHPH